MTNSIDVKKTLKKLANPTKAEILQGFFKTGKGEYGEGDSFLGIKVPEQRKIAKKFKDLKLNEIQILLKSQIHEERLTALLILVEQYQKSDRNKQKQIYQFYLKQIQNINNWDLVDLSAPKIVGDFLLNNSREILYKLAKSQNLWKKRIAIVSTWTLIRNLEFKETLEISEILLNDKHDLIHKAVGWMLREVGKKDQKIEEEFLQKHYQIMPRTMLRYAIERFDERKRKFYLQK